MPTARFTTASAILCSAIIVASPVLAADFTWDGNGDPNNGGNWSDPLNWDVGAGYPDDTNDTANLPAPSLVRLITVDVPTTNDTLHVVADSANSRLRLDADLHLDTFDGSGSGWLTKLDLNGFTLSVNKANTAYLPELDGAGHLLKVGAGTATLQAENNFTGSMTISNGTVFFRCGDYTTASKLSVLDGGTAEIGGVCAIAPSVVEINGPGFSGLGALEFTGNPQTFASAVTVATDAKIRRAAGSTMTRGRA
jgi:autotransporter-associated beta strand protein